MNRTLVFYSVKANPLIDYSASFLREQGIFVEEGMNGFLDEDGGVFFLTQEAVDNVDFRNALSTFLIQKKNVLIIALEQIKGSPAFISQMNMAPYYMVQSPDVEEMLGILREHFDMGEKKTTSSWDEPTAVIAGIKISLLRERTGEEIVIGKEGLVIGRSPLKCNYTVRKNRTVGREHAKITIDHQRCFLEDLDSTNGTYINSTRVMPGERRELHHKDEIQLSDEVFTVHIDWSMPAAARKK